MLKCYDLSAKGKNIKVHICFFGGGVVMLCGVKVKSGQMSLESFA